MDTWDLNQSMIIWHTKTTTKELEMATRITNKELDILVNKLNTLTNNPLKPYEYTDGKCIPQPGNYHLDAAYGGIKLCQQCESGGSRNISTQGYGTKKEMYHFLEAIITGLEIKSKHELN